jgi:phosphate starvation-inducible PhoH-like protein
MQSEKRLTKRQRRLLRQQSQTVENKFQLKRILPLTQNQQLAFDSYKDGKNLMLHGTAGTGKTFSAIYLGMKDVFTDEYQKVVLVRSIVPSRDIGFLPGSQEEKIKVYELPYIQICSELFGRADAYELLKAKQKVEFISTSFIRGVTISDSVVIIDECQNMTWPELSTILTRIGENCKVIICGDTKQTDLNERNGKGDLLKLIRVCQNIGSFEFIQMSRNDIVRSGFVREFIIECENLGY